jgi:hypothetical protein
MGPSARVTPRPARWLIHRLPSVGSGWAPGHGPVRADRATSITGAQRLRPLLAEGGGALTACGGPIGYRWMAAARPAARIRTVPAGVPVTGNFAALLATGHRGQIRKREVLLRQPGLGAQLLPAALPVCERKLRNSSNLLEAAIATPQ